MRIERQVLFWVAAGVALMLVLALIREVLLPFVIGVGIAYFLNPIADRLERAGLSRMAAAVLIIVTAGIAVAVALFLLVPLASNQMRQLAVTLPDDLTRLKSGLEAWANERFADRLPSVRAGIDKAIGDLSQGWSSMLAVLLQSAWSRGMAIVNFISLLLVTPIVVFYLLVDWHPMLAKLDGWLPRDHAPAIRRISGEINDAIAAFVRGQGVICLILGVFYALALTLIGVRYGLLIGVITGFLAFVPYVGWAIGLLAACIGALAQGWPDLGLLFKVVAIFAAGMAVDSAVLSPKIVGAKVGLHPVWLIFAIFVFSYLFGFVGILVAVPVAAAVGVLVRFALSLYLDSTVYRGAGGPTPGQP